MIETTIGLLRALGVRGLLLALLRFGVAGGVLALAVALGGRVVRPPLDSLLGLIVPEPKAGFGFRSPGGIPEAAALALPFALLAMLALAAMSAAGRAAAPAHAPRRSWRHALLLVFLGGAVFAALFLLGCVAETADQVELFALSLVALVLPLGALSALVPPRLVVGSLGVATAPRRGVADGMARRVFVAAICVVPLVIGVASPRNLLLARHLPPDAARVLSWVGLAASAFVSTYVGGVAAVALVLPDPSEPAVEARDPRSGSALERTLVLLERLGFEGLAVAGFRFLGAVGVTYLVASRGSWRTRDALEYLARALVPWPTGRSGWPFGAVEWWPDHLREATVATLPFGLFAILWLAATAAATRALGAPARVWARALLLGGSFSAVLLAGTFCAVALNEVAVFLLEALILGVPFALRFWLAPARLFLSPLSGRAALREAVCVAPGEARRVFSAVVPWLVPLVGAGVVSVGTPGLWRVVTPETARSAAAFLVASCVFVSSYVGGVAAVAAVQPGEDEAHA